MSSQGPQGSPPGGPGRPPQGQGPPQTGPPYAPRNASLGGVPSKMPDIPITGVFLFLFVVFAIVHMKILKKNNARGHKFLFSGALFAFCVIRIATMSLRIAWATQNLNIRLAIAAQIFVYVGTIILFIVNWFFTQRIVRAQHPRWGWSKPYRVLHRAGLAFLICCLFMLIAAAVQQFFTLDSNTLRIDRNLQLAGQTYFAAFCAAPLVLITISLIIPRRGTEKFGAGRLRNNIMMLAIAVLILSAGAIFRCVTTWLPPVPLRGPRGRPNPIPWYFSRECFYVFNFTTEILVVILYAVVRVDLRFHIPDGSKGPGAYSGRGGYHVGIIGKETNLKRSPTSPTMYGGYGGYGMHPNGSNETLHMYEDSIFDDTKTLADSLRYPSSILEVDSKTGYWKIKRVSGTSSIHSTRRQSRMSEQSLWSPDRETWIGNAPPPVPKMPPSSGEWPLRGSEVPRGSISLFEHQNMRSRSGTGTGSERSQVYEQPKSHWSHADMGNAIADAISKLEANSEINKRGSLENLSPAPPGYDSAMGSRKVSPIEPAPGPDIPRKHNYAPPSSDISKKHNYAPPSSDLPKKQTYIPYTPPRSTIELQPIRKAPSGSDTGRSYEAANEGSRRFSFESPGDGYEGTGSESERSLDRRR
ncbi:hypothetical protein K469DRAFT_720476 [Zopfia rhizophila CBS 207.26]|uniref:Uncharacterized protein n=1 Tax=Zopfia rhizophila CBS 207.26 TaxID=1314779 RepID=A0A6A6EN05_9PEZI|nr:hypothetical protein K469DRAFT_720476 [Zopfia rhizophila CBS 207.26]